MKKLNYRKESSNLRHAIVSYQGEKFESKSAAWKAASCITKLMFLQDFLTSLTLSPQNNMIEMCIHLKSARLPYIPDYCTFTSYDITSHCYWSDATNKLERIRCITFYFKY